MGKMSQKQDILWNGEKAALVAKILRQADKILVGIGAGFSAAAGLRPIGAEIVGRSILAFLAAIYSGTAAEQGNATFVQAAGAAVGGNRLFCD